MTSCSNRMQSPNRSSQSGVVSSCHGLGTFEGRWAMKKPSRVARWQLRNRLSVVELTLPRQVSPTRAPGDPAQSITVLLLAPVGPKSADTAARILHLGVGRVLRVSSIAAVRRLDHPPTTSDVAIIGWASWSNSRRLHRNLRRAGWSEVIIRSDGAAAAEFLGVHVNQQECINQGPSDANAGPHQY